MQTLNASCIWAIKTDWDIAFENDPQGDSAIFAFNFT